MSEKKIWKTELTEPMDRQIITVPAVSTPLCVQVQNGVPCIWWEVDPDQPQSDAEIFTVGTGHEEGPLATYIGTVQMAHTWHYYWRWFNG